MTYPGLIVALALTGTPVAVTAATIDELLAQPTTAGRVTLMLTDSRDPRVQALWRESVAGENSRLRAATARAIAAAGLREYLPQLERVLEIEDDPQAKYEQIRALLLLGEATARKRVMQRVAKMEPTVRVPVERWLEGRRSRFAHRDRLRQYADYPPGLVDDVVTETGCKVPPAESAYGAARLTFRADRKKQIELIAWPPGDEHCKRAVAALMAATIPPDGPLSADETERSHTFMVMLDSERNECSAGWHRLAGGYSTPPAGPEVENPKPIERGEPIYPPSAKKERVQGTIFAEAVITKAGCVTDSIVLKSGDLRLQAAALTAMSKWRFEPASRDGKPLHSLFTSALKFELKRPE